MSRQVFRRTAVAFGLAFAFQAAAPLMAQICSTAEACWQELVLDLYVIQFYEYNCVTETVCV